MRCLYVWFTSLQHTKLREGRSWFDVRTCWENAFSHGLAVTRKVSTAKKVFVGVMISFSCPAADSFTYKRECEFELRPSRRGSMRG